MIGSLGIELFWFWSGWGYSDAARWFTQGSFWRSAVEQLEIVEQVKTGWWFQRCFIFTPKIGEDSHFDDIIFFDTNLKNGVFFEMWKVNPKPGGWLQRFVYCVHLCLRGKMKLICGKKTLFEDRWGDFLATITIASGWFWLWDDG